MENFTYTARTLLGQSLQGSLQALNRSTAIATLKKQGLFLVAINHQNALVARWRDRLSHQRVSLQQRSLFTQQLATLLKAAMPLNIALKTLANQLKNKTFSTIIAQLRQDIEEADSLSTAMAKHTHAFPPVYTAIIHAAEQTAMLPETLNHLSQQLKNQSAIHSHLRRAMAYPLFLLLIGSAVVTILVHYVVPKFVVLFINSEQALPLPTQILVGSIHWSQNHWPILLLLPTGLVGLISWLYQQPNSRLKIDALLLRLPLIGDLNQKLQTARFARTLAALLSGGVRIIEAMTITQNTTTNQAFKQALTQTTKRLTRGDSLAKSLQAQNEFSDILINMATVGEKTAALPEMLDEVAQIYDQQTKDALTTLTNLLGPTMIVFLGVLIGFVVLAILLPIFDTSTLIS